MKRNNFIRLAVTATATILTAPLTAFTRRRAEKRTDKGFFVAAGGDRYDKSIHLFEGESINIIP